jgi:hypothetical protein
MTRAILPVAVRKEIRALFPVWLASLLALAAAAVTRDSRVTLGATLAYGVGAIILGAQSIGHEYSHRTLDQLLSLPVERRRLFLVKFVVLALMVTALTVLASTVVYDTPMRRRLWTASGAAIGAPAASLFIAPALTLVGRSPLAGTVLTLGLSGAMLVLSELIAAAMAPSRADYPALRFTIWTYGVAAVSLIGGISSWRLFMRLEAIDDPGSQIDVPSLRGAARARTRHPLRSLFVKELYLQQLTFAVVAVYLVFGAVIAIVGARQRYEGGRDAVIDVALMLTFLYCLLLSILIGSLASAEERHLGTLESQALLPVAARQQWAVKVVTAIGLALLFGVVLPVALTWFMGVPSLTNRLGQVVAAVIVLTSLSLYLSSLSRSGVRAFVWTLPVAIAAGAAIEAIGSVLESVLTRLPVQWIGDWLPPGFDRGPFFPLRTESDVLWFAIIVAFLALLVGFASINHRSEWNVRRIAGQVACLAAYFAFGTMLVMVAR